MRRFSLAVMAALVAGDIHAGERPLMRVDEVVVTATRFKDRYVDTPVNVTVIDAEAIRASGARTVPDLLAAQAGVNVRDLFGNNAASATVDLRGFGATGGQNTLILIDGRRATDIDLSGVQWAAVPLASVERIEIVRGSGAVLYGDGATAGVINIITRAPLAAGMNVSVEGRAGGYGTREIRLDAGHGGERAGFGVSAANFESDGYRANNRNRQAAAQADLLFLSDRGELSLKLGADRQGLRLPGARTVQPSAGIDELATDRRGTSTPRDYATRDGNRALIDWRRDTAFGEFLVGAGWRDKAQTAYFDFGGFPDYRETRLDVWALAPRIRVAYGAPGAAGTLVAGLGLASVALPPEALQLGCQHRAAGQHRGSKTGECRHLPAPHAAAGRAGCAERGRAPRAVRDSCDRHVRPDRARQRVRLRRACRIAARVSARLRGGRAAAVEPRTRAGRQARPQLPLRQRRRDL